jgi:hypothetical protein
MAKGDENGESNSNNIVILVGVLMPIRYLRRR